MTVAAVAPALIAALAKPKSAMGNPTLQPTSAVVTPQLLAAQLQAQDVNNQLQSNEQAGQNLHGGVGEFVPRMLAQALLHGQSKTANVALAQAQMAQRTGAAKSLFPDDPQAQLAYLLDPENMGKSFAARYAPLDARGGNTLINAPPSVAGAQGSAPGTYTVPKLDIQNDHPIVQTAAGTQVQGALPMGYGQQTAQAAQQETAAQNQRANALAAQGLSIQQQQANAAQTQAAAAQSQAASSAQSSSVGAANSQNFNLPPGYVIKGP